MQALTERDQETVQSQNAVCGADVRPSFREETYLNLQGSGVGTRQEKGSQAKWWEDLRADDNRDNLARAFIYSYELQGQTNTSPAMLQALLIWGVFATFLTPINSQSCIKASESQCNNADFIPGSNLAGEGFDITTMERKGAFVIDMSSWLKKDRTCTLCKNPYMRGEKQKLPASVVDWRPSQKCRMKVSSSVYHSSESLVSSSTSSIENRWQTDLNIVTPKVQGSVMMAGTNSKLAEYSMQKTKNDKFSFTSQIVKCGYYKYRVSNRPVLHPELSEDFKSLPQRYDKSTKHLYFKLIDMFGTHYITKVTLGGEIRSVTSIKECQASLQVQGSVMMAGTNSKLAKYSMQKTKKDKFSFTSQIVKCGYYNYRVLKRPVISHDLNEDLKSLPQRYDKSTKHLYFKLIDMFGTHYIMKVRLGGEIRSVTSIKECQASLQGLSVDEVKSCLDLEASVSMGIGSDMQNEAHHCKKAKEKSMNKRSFSSTFSDRETNVFGGNTENVDLLFSSNTDPKAYKEWVSSLPAHPDVLSYSLMPLHDLLPRKSSIRAHLRKAIEDYILQRALIRNCASPCKTGVKTNPKEPCSCSCHNNKGVALNCCPTQKGFAHVTVTIIKATGLYGDYFGQTDGYVKILLNGNHPRGKTSIIPDNDNPVWNRNFHLETVDLSKFGSVKLEVWDEDSGSDDDLLGGCSVQLKSGANNNICSLNHGLLYYKVQVNCITGLTGSSCMEYNPSPMDSQLKKVYISRNAYPIPRDMLLEMGVLLDERIPRFNMSNIRKAEGLEL
ncbi:hypothetical protein HF521_004229 [Silurus meridionalis]|uniref:Perforin-1-like n=1 Tax=Silurus meridionalis TaxID=175797 RepID=A0A8T0AW19_SILME|nr:hypothetical protein HF521_004229 [Silurus meridionalis]